MQTAEGAVSPLQSKQSLFTFPSIKREQKNIKQRKDEWKNKNTCDREVVLKQMLLLGFLFILFNTNKITGNR